jgi:hypothetical protein
MSVSSRVLEASKGLAPRSIAYQLIMLTLTSLDVLAAPGADKKWGLLVSDVRSLNVGPTSQLFHRQPNFPPI